MEVLSFALTDEEHEVQLAAARALGRLCSAPDAPRAGDVLNLVERSGAPNLVAATVRAIGEGMSATYHARLAESRRVNSLPARPPPGKAGLFPSPAPPSAELVSALAFAAREAPSPVAMAAVDSLGHAHRAGAASAIERSPPPSTTPTRTWSRRPC